MNVEINNPVFLQVAFGQTNAGLATVGYKLRNPDNSIYQARTQVGVQDNGNGNYGVLKTFIEIWDGFIEWDTGGGTPIFATEEIQVYGATPLLPAYAGGEGNIPRFLRRLRISGSTVLYHRDNGETECPCRTPEGFRDPHWHLLNPGATLCNEIGMLPGPGGDDEFLVKAFVQPIQSTRATRLTDEALISLFGEVHTDDHLGIFPCEWESKSLDFRNWSDRGEDYIEYADQRFTSVNANLIPDPANGNPYHHWEVGLRVINPKPVNP